MYEYRATVLAIHDGDTITVDVDLGFGIRFEEMHLRLLGLNAPELNTTAGKLSQSYLVSIMPLGSTITIQTEKDKQEKYGRYLATLISDKWGNINQALITNGYAKAWDGKGARPV